MVEYGADECAALCSERVHHHLSLSARADKAVRAQRAHVVGDEVLGALDDPAEIADAELLCLGQSAGEGQPCRVGEGSRAAGSELGSSGVETLTPDSLGDLKVETQQIAMVVSHLDILTCIVVFRL